MKKHIAIPALVGLLFLSASTANAITINDSTTFQDALNFGPSSAVELQYFSGINGTITASGDEPQQYVAAAKHIAGNTSVMTTDNANLMAQKNEDWRGMDLSECITDGLPDFTGASYLGDNIEILNAAGWEPL